MLIIIFFFFEKNNKFTLWRYTHMLVRKVLYLIESNSMLLFFFGVFHLHFMGIESNASKPRTCEKKAWQNNDIWTFIFINNVQHNYMAWYIYKQRVSYSHQPFDPRLCPHIFTQEYNSDFLPFLFQLHHIFGSISVVLALLITLWYGWWETS